ncbi:YbjN domain-containing protein [Actinomycetaceae bacterium TAE3-ERU4]|nr:YbjN domain-containing protein [Actinomycetaceae bacterium TAE3-ERU4]
MTSFNPESENLPTVTCERIQALLARFDYATQIAPDGSVQGNWNGINIEILPTADWLSTATIWNPDKEIEGFSTLDFKVQQMLLIMLCEQWNSLHVQPRAYPYTGESVLSPADTSTLSSTGLTIRADVNLSIRRGMSEEQLESALMFSLAACVNAAETLAELMPPIF